MPFFGPQSALNAFLCALCASAVDTIPVSVDAESFKHTRPCLAVAVREGPMFWVHAELTANKHLFNRAYLSPFAPETRRHRPPSGDTGTRGHGERRFRRTANTETRRLVCVALVACPPVVNSMTRFALSLTVPDIRARPAMAQPHYDSSLAGKPPVPHVVPAQKAAP